MKKFKFLVGFGLRKRLFKKSFIISNLILGILIMALINIPSIITLFSDEAEEEEAFRVSVVNNTDEEAYPLEDNLLSVLNTSYMDRVYEAVPWESEEFARFWDQEEVDILLVFSGDLAQSDVSIYTTHAEQQSFLSGQVQNVLNDYQNITYANFDFESPPQGEEGEGSTEDELLNEANNSFIEGIISLLFLPVFILIIMATQFLGVDIIEEKASKAIETIISSVPAKVHFLSKITSSIAFLVIQSSVLVLFIALGAFLENVFINASENEVFSVLGGLAERMPNWPYLLALSIGFLLFGTLIFLTLAALLASVATTQEDYQQYQAPLIFLLLGGYYMGIFLPILEADGMIRIASYLPFFSTIVAPIAYATGVIGLGEGIITLGITILMAVFFLYLIGPVYRVAILSYEETKFFKRIRFYIKKAFHR